MRVYLLLVMGLFLGGCNSVEITETELSLASEEQAIRNGTRDPETVDLSAGQILALGWLHATGQPGGNFCTGTLVAPRVVATARHCIESGRERGISFGMGLDPREPEATFVVQSAHGHPELDAAILILAEDATSILPTVVPIPFNRDPITPDFIGQEVQAGGYGETYDRRLSGRFFATVEISNILPNEVIVDGRGRQGICFGDSGGPVIITRGDAGPVVLGVESWGDPSCLGIDHLIRLDRIADWIDETTADATRPPDEECSELPREGVCDVQVVERCDSGRFTRIDCEAQGLECRMGDGTRRMGCFEIDVCANVGSTGVCDGDTVVRCRFGELRYDDCAMSDQVCQADTGGAFCTDAEPTEDTSPEMASTTEDEDTREPDPEPESVETEPLPDEADADEDDIDDEATGDPMGFAGQESSGQSGCSALPALESNEDPWFALTLCLILGLSRRRRLRN